MHPPRAIDGLPIVCFTRIDERHRPSGATKHWVGGELQGAAAGLAICASEGGCYLFHCDAQWAPITDTWHDSVADAKAQAEFEYSGTSATWECAD